MMVHLYRFFVFMLFSSQYLLFEIKRNKTGDIFSGSSPYCDVSECSCPTDKPTLLGESPSKKCAADLGCTLHVKLDSVNSTKLYFADGINEKYSLNIITGTSTPICIGENLVENPIFVQDYQTRMFWNVGFNDIIFKEVNAVVIENGVKVQLNISKHWTGLLVKFFIGCDMANQQCVTIKFSGVRKYPLTEEIIKSVVQPIPTINSPSELTLKSSTTILSTTKSPTTSSLLTTSLFDTSKAILFSTETMPHFQCKSTEAQSYTFSSTIGVNSIIPSNSLFSSIIQSSPLITETSSSFLPVSSTSISTSKSLFPSIIQSSPSIIETPSSFLLVPSTSISTSKSLFPSIIQSSPSIIETPSSFLLVPSTSISTSKSLFPSIMQSSPSIIETLSSLLPVSNTSNSTSKSLLPSIMQSLPSIIETPLSLRPVSSTSNSTSESLLASIIQSSPSTIETSSSFLPVSSTSNSTANKTPTFGKSTSPDDDHRHIIIGVVLAAFVIIIIIILVILVKRKRNRKKKIPIDKNEKKFATQYNHASIRALNNYNNRTRSGTITSTPFVLNTISNSNPTFQNSQNGQLENHDNEGLDNAAFDE